MMKNWYPWAILLTCVIAIIVWRRFDVANKNKEYDETHYVVFDETNLTLRLGEEEKSFPWTKLEKITLHSTDDGPWNEDQFYELYFGDDEYLTLPSEFKGVTELVKDYILNLDGLDEKLFIKAMGTTTNKSFEIYVK